MKDVREDVSGILNEILQIVERTIEINLKKYPDHVFSQYSSPETYLDIIDNIFSDFFREVERLKKYLKIRKELYRTLRELITTIQLATKEMEVTPNEVRILILPIYKRLLDIRLENMKIIKEIEKEAEILEIISEHSKKSLKRIELASKILGYNRKRNTDDLEEAMLLLVQENVIDAKKKIERIKQRLQQTENSTNI